MNKNGLESIPFLLLISVIIIMFAITLFSDQLVVFFDFKEKNEFYNNINNFIDTMKVLRSTSDFGSFQLIEINIPSSFSLVISKENINIYKNDQEEKNMSFVGEGINITGIKGLKNTNELRLNEGNHKIQLYYGEPLNLKEWMISFK